MVLLKAKQSPTSSEFQSIVQQQEATSSYSKIGQLSPAKQYQRSIKKLKTQGSGGIRESQQQTQNSLLTPTVISTRQKPLINYSEGVVDDYSASNDQ